MKSDFHIAVKLLRIGSNLHFLRLCRKNGIVPHGLYAKNPLKNSYNCPEAKNLQYRQSIQWLKLTINAEYKRRDRTLKYVFPQDESKTHRLHALQTQLQKTKSKKLSMLLHEKRKENHQSDIHGVDTNLNGVSGFDNRANIGISRELNDLLSQGPSFTVPNSSMHGERLLKELKAELEFSMAKLEQIGEPKEIINEFSGGILNICKPALLQNTRQDRICTSSVMKELRSIPDDTLIIPTDKTSRLLSITRDEYDSMFRASVLESRNFTKVREAKPVSRQTNFNQKLSNIANNYRAHQENIYKWLMECKCSEPIESSAYVLPKDHKTGPLTGRPIVAALDGPGTRLAKCLSSCFTNLFPAIPAHLPNSDSFVNWIKNFSDSNIGGFASLDVINLYGNIPRHDGDKKGMYSVVKDFLNFHAVQDNMLAQMDVNDITKLVELAMENDFVLIDGSSYRQVNGLSMGNPLAPALAVIYMDYVESNILRLLPSGIQWCRYIDDVFVVWPTTIDSDTLLGVCNSYSEHIQFKIELPNDHGFLPFLDCEIWKDNQRFQSRLFSKDYHSKSIFPWNSNGPISRKRSIVVGELHRAVRRSTCEESEKYSINKVMEKFKANCYPARFLSSILRKFKQKKSPSQKDTKDVTYIKVPFTGEAQRRKIMSLLQRTKLSDKVRVTFNAGIPLKRKLHPPKERRKCKESCEICKSGNQSGNCFNKGVVYEIKCNLCSKIYIGESARTVQSRIQEHTKHPNSAVFSHFKDNHTTEAIIQNITWRIVHRNLQNWHKRVNLESLYISEVPKHLLMNGCFGRQLKYS